MGRILNALIRTLALRAKNYPPHCLLGYDVSSNKVEKCFLLRPPHRFLEYVTGP